MCDNRNRLEILYRQLPPELQRYSRFSHLNDEGTDHWRFQCGHKAIGSGKKVDAPLVNPRNEAPGSPRRARNPRESYWDQTPGQTSDDWRFGGAGWNDRLKRTSEDGTSDDWSFGGGGRKNDSLKRTSEDRTSEGWGFGGGGRKNDPLRKTSEDGMSDKVGFGGAGWNDRLKRTSEDGTSEDLGYAGGGSNWGADGISDSSSKPKKRSIETEPVVQKKRQSPGTLVHTEPVKADPNRNVGEPPAPHETARPAGVSAASKPTKPKLNGSVVVASECNESECCVCKKKFTRPKGMNVVKLNCDHVMHRECCCNQIIKDNFCPKCFVPIVIQQ